MKNIFTLLLFSLFTFAGVQSAKAGVIVFNQDLEYIEQVANGPSQKIGQMYAGDTYTFYISASDAWQLEAIPPGLQISVNNEAYVTDYAYGPTGFSSVKLYADPTALGGYALVLTVIQEGVPYRYEMEVLKKADADGKFSCPTTTVEAAPGFSQLYTDVVELTVTGKPVLLTSGRVLGVADDGRIRVEYTGDPLVMTTGTKKIPVTVFVSSDANVGTYEVALDQVSNIDSGCTWKIVVAKQSCVFTLDCSNPTIDPNNFIQGVSASSLVIMNYTLAGCSSYTFDAVMNVPSQGVNGLTLNLNSKNITTPTGVVTGSITGIPTSAGTATFNIPNYCSFSVEVKAKGAEFELICSDDLLTVCTKLSCGKPCTTFTELTGINYKLLSGTKNIDRWVGPKVTGLYAEVPKQTLKSPSGRAQVYIKGKPTKTGIIKVPVTIEGKTCYISVNVITSGEVMLDCSRTASVAGKYCKTLSCKYTYLYYSLSCGSQKIKCWTGPKVDGVYAYICAQTLKETSSGKVKVYIKGKPTRTGTIKVPVTIAGKTCYVDVIVN